jgi:hypothetical protein
MAAARNWATGHESRVQTQARYRNCGLSNPDGCNGTETEAERVCVRRLAPAHVLPPGGSAALRNHSETRSVRFKTRPNNSHVLRYEN